MSTVKKLLALVLALTMALSISAAAAYSVVPYGDADGIDAGAAEAVEMLYNMGIMKGDDKGNFNPNATITRAEVAKMIYVVLNYGKDDKAVNYTGAKFFSDVESGAWYEGYVNYAASIKLVQGRPDGTFGPNDPVTCAEAAKMLLTAIGYSAEARGYVGAGWDTQVLSDASILGLLDGYNYNTQTYAPRQWVAVMFFNALTEALTYDTIVPAVFNGLLTGTNYGDYVTMGEKYFKLKSFKGIITANEYADLFDDEALDAGETQVGKLVFDNWSTGLTEIGEYARGWYSGDDVLYVTGDGKNTEFSCGGDVTIKKANIDGIKLDKNTEFFKNFEPTTAYEEGTAVAKGDWLRVVDNDDDGYAEYVFVTEFTMDTVTKKTSSKLTLSTVAATGDFATESELAKDDVVVYVYIDGTYYVEEAEEFTGEVDKYTYKNKTLTVDDKDYDQTEIALSAAVKNAYFTELELAKKEIEYTYYMDFFGNIGAFGRTKADAGELVLLTDAYFETNRSGKVAAVDAYLDGEIKDVDVKRTKDYASFIDTTDTSSNNDWNKLIAYAGDAKAATNVARYTLNDEGVMTLYTAQTVKYNNKALAYDVITDYINLADTKLEAGQRTFDATYAEPTFVDGEITTTTAKAGKVQANKDTVYYYVSYANDYPVVETVVGYKNSYDVTNVLKADEIYAAYAIATSVAGEAEDADADATKDYWVADVIVIETKYPVFAQDSQMVLGYNVVNKTYSDYAALDVLTAEGAKDDLNVIFYNGLDYDEFSREDDIAVLEFYYATTDEDGMSYIRTVTNYADAGIYAGKLNRIADLGKEYVVTVDGIELYYDEASIVVYDINKGTRANTAKTTDSDDETLELTKGETYIFVGDKDEEIVYAILVNDTMTKKLYDKIADDYSAVVAEAVEALEEYAAAAAEYWTVEVEDIQAALDAEIAAVKAMDEADIAAYIKNDNDNGEFGTAIWNIWYAAQAAKAKAEADAAADDATITITSDKAVLVDGVAYTAPVKAEIGDVLTLEFAAEVIVSATGADAVKGDSLKIWTITITGNEVAITVAQ